MGHVLGRVPGHWVGYWLTSLLGHLPEILQPYLVKHLTYPLGLQL